MKYKHDHLYKNEKKNINNFTNVYKFKNIDQNQNTKNYLFAGVMLFQIKIFVDFVQANIRI